MQYIRLNKYKPLILLVLYTITPASANEFRSPRAAALGGAGHANPLLNDSVFQNPSFASFLPVYSWSGSFKSLGEGRGRAYSLSVLDGRSEFVQAAAAYTVRDELTALHLGVSKKLAPKLTLGIGAKFFYSKAKNRFENSRNVSLSATAAPTDWLQIALIGDNLLSPAGTSQLGLEREVVLGTKLKVNEKVLLYIDPHAHLAKGLDDTVKSTFAYEAGTELQVYKDLYLRVGTFKNIAHPDLREKSNGFGYGIGWVAPRMSFDFAVERVLSPADRLTHTSSVTLYF